MRDEVLLAAVVRVPVSPLPPLLDADEVLDRVEAALEAGRRQEVLHRHALPQVERHHLKERGKDAGLSKIMGAKLGDFDLC